MFYKIIAAIRKDGCDYYKGLFLYFTSSNISYADYL